MKRRRFVDSASTSGGARAPWHVKEAAGAAAGENEINEMQGSDFRGDSGPPPQASILRTSWLGSLMLQARNDAGIHSD